MPPVPAPFNQQLKALGTDVLYHLGLDSSQDLSQFKDTHLVAMHGSPVRARAFATRVKSELFGGGPAPEPIGKTERCEMYKVGPVISISHGMGMPSMLIFLHEVTKLLIYAGADLQRVRYVRIGTSGGVACPAGSVVIAKDGCDATFVRSFEQVRCGVKHRFPAVSDPSFCAELEKVKGSIPIEVGTTMGCDDFYEAQSRLDGVLDSGYTLAEKTAWLERCAKEGVKNIEMESTAFLAFLGRANIKGTVVCCTLLNRTLGDQVTSTPEMLGQYAERAQSLVINWIQAHAMQKSKL